ncbi:MAG: FAD-dependent oxidoreductase [Caulobacterales bacterium]
MVGATAGHDPADIVIAGGGFAGALLALVLGRQGRTVNVIDLHAPYPSDFRCEKFNPVQADLLRDLGVQDCFHGAGLAHEGLRYETMVNALRDRWPENVRFVLGRAVGLTTGDDIQTVRLADGRDIRGRLLAVATGQGEKLRAALGVRRRVIRERQSLSVGFSLVRRDGAPFAFRSLVRQGQRSGDRIAFANLFPIGEAMRINLFTYHDAQEAWTLALRADPIAVLLDTLPGLDSALGEVALAAPVEIRCVDLYTSEGHVQPGTVLLGDAFATSCPATGMGVTRILTEVRQLAQVYVPAWFATPGMSQDKIACFYADPAKRGFERLSLRRSNTGRGVAVETSLAWRAYRGAVRLKRAARLWAAGLMVRRRDPAQSAR